MTNLDRVALPVLFLVQRGLLLLTYVMLWPFFRRSEPQGVVLGPEEIASCLAHMGQALHPSVTVNLFPHPFYDYAYTYDLSRYRALRWLMAPCLLAYLTHRHRIFVYVGGHGFLASHLDGRAAEFKFLRARQKQVACYFAGSEIRSHRLLDEFGALHDLDVLTTYQKYSAPGLASQRSEARRRKLAEAADRYAEVIFNPPVDQMSYLTSETHPFLYFYPDEQIRRVPEKWQDPQKLVLVHAPSSPFIKGTPLVRAAVKHLRSEGFDFEYVELIDRPHEEVLASLRRAHIVLNQFYSFVPGVLGIEAMAANAVLLTSADRDIEPSLFEGANDAWVVTPYWLVYERLREVLSTPERLRAQADCGTAWVARWCTQTFSGDLLRRSLNV